MWRMGILNSYTMESTFGGSTLGKLSFIHHGPLWQEEAKPSTGKVKSL